MNRFSSLRPATPCTQASSGITFERRSRASNPFGFPAAMVTCFALAFSLVACVDDSITPQFDTPMRSLAEGTQHHDHTLTAIGDSVFIATPKEPTLGTTGTLGYWSHPNNPNQLCPWPDGHKQHSRCVWIPATKGDPGDPTFVRLKNLSPATLDLTRTGYSKGKAEGVGYVEVATEKGTRTISVLVQVLSNPQAPGHPAAPVASVQVSPTNVSVTTGQSAKLTATLKDANGDTLMDRKVTWTSSNTSVATVSNAGEVSGIAAGSVTITATAEDKSGSVAVAVASPIGPSTWIFPGDDIQKKVKDHPAGTTFHIKAGIHRLQQITPKDGNRFIGEPGAVLNGSKLLTGWTRESGRWWVADRDGIRSINTSGSCMSAYPRCQHPVELFVNDEPLRHVGSLGEVGPGTWFFDYTAQRIYVGSDPTGKTIERSLTARAFDGTAKHVTIRNLQIEKYSTRFQEGAIHGTGGDSWVVEDNVIRLNHGVGIRLGDRMQVRRNKVLRNGQLGIGGGRIDVLVEGNEIAYNNFAGVSPGWEAGGTKFVKTTRLVVRGNHVHHNNGKALWTDIDNIHTLYENNLVEDNGHQGIFHEISYDAVIRGNTVRRNGFERAGSWIRAAGIFIANSPNVEVYGNLVEDNFHGITAVQQARGSGAHGPYLLRNLWVHNNTVRMSSNQRTGVARDDGDNTVFLPAGNNRFERNTYYVSDVSARWFAWEGSNRTWSGWRDNGQDKNGNLGSR